MLKSKNPHPTTRADGTVQDALERRVRGEYLEMPGLRLTTAQAARLWGMDPLVCDAILTSLCDNGFLVHGHGDTFARRT
jgi:hypothetical protein